MENEIDVHVEGADDDSEQSDNEDIFGFGFNKKKETTQQIVQSAAPDDDRLKLEKDLEEVSEKLNLCEEAYQDAISKLKNSVAQNDQFQAQIAEESANVQKLTETNHDL